MISRPRGGMRVAFWSFLCPAPDLVSSLQYTQNFESKKLWVFSADRNSHALAVSREGTCRASCHPTTFALLAPEPIMQTDRKSTRLNSSHVSISYAVFCLKKKKKQ